MVQKTASSKRMATRKRKVSSNETVEAFSSSTTCSAAAAAAVEQPRKRYMGVRQSPSGRWVAEIKGTAQKIRLWLGTFDTAEAAAQAYDEAACLLRGSNTRTNFWPRSAGPSVLPSKVFNHLLRHLEIQRAAGASSNSTSSALQSSMPLPSPQQQQLNNKLETEAINRVDYSELLSDVSISSTTNSEEESEFSMSYNCNNTESILGDMNLRLEEDLSCLYAPFEMAMVMEELRRKPEMGTFDFWFMLSAATRSV